MQANFPSSCSLHQCLPLVVGGVGLWAEFSPHFTFAHWEATQHHSRVEHNYINVASTQILPKHLKLGRSIVSNSSQ